MWFRNLRLYRITSHDKLDRDIVDSQLAKRPLMSLEIGVSQEVSRGWVCPRQEGVYVHAVERQWLIALGIEQKLLPAKVIRHEVLKRVAAIERDQGRKVGRKEMRDLTERVTEELLPKAMTTRRTTWAWLDPVNGWLVIDASSDARADEFIETLLATLDGFSPRPLKSQVSPVAAMTDWMLSYDSPAHFTLDSDMELRSASQAQAVIRYVHHDISGEEVARHISVGKIVAKLGMTWKDRIFFVLTDKLHIKRLTFLDVVKEQSPKEGARGEDLFNADFVLMAGELAQMIADLLAALSGESAVTE